MKYTDEQYAKKLAEMCNKRRYAHQPYIDGHKVSKCPGNLAHMRICPNKRECKDVDYRSWLAYLRRWPGLHGQKRGDL